MVQLIERAASAVARRHGGNARLFVGEVSKENGGRIAGHGSHQNGRDVDIAYYAVDESGSPHSSYEFVKFGRHGIAFGRHKGLRFDVAKNWELVANLVADRVGRIQHIFVSDPVRRRLLHYAKLAQTDPVIYDRARRVLTQPSQGHRHDNHFHVRIYCDPADRPKCKDQVPIFSWYPREETPTADAHTARAADTQIATNL